MSKVSELGPLRRVVGIGWTKERLECGHVIRRRSFSKVTRRRCWKCK